MNSTTSHASAANTHKPANESTSAATTESARKVQPSRAMMGCGYALFMVVGRCARAARRVTESASVRVTGSCRRAARGTLGRLLLQHLFDTARALDGVRRGHGRGSGIDGFDAAGARRPGAIRRECRTSPTPPWRERDRTP